MPPEFDRYAAEYEAQLARGLKLTGESRSHFMERRVAWLAERLARRLVKRPRVLDFGCGIGAATPYLVEMLGAQQVYGYDVSSRSIALARESHLTPLAEFGDLLPGPGVFSLAHVNGVFHHIPPPDRPAAVAQICHSLEAGGFLAFFENNPLNPLMLYSMSQVEFDRDAQTLTPWASVALLKAGGLEILSVDFLFFFPAFLRWLRPLEPYLRKVPFGAQYLVLARKPTVP
jgi:SAM-dependent methyltransferase